VDGANHPYTEQTPMAIDLPLHVLHQDEHVLAVEKPAGMAVHPAYRNPRGTLVDVVCAWCAERGLARPWLVHRLDRVTSGIVLFACTERARGMLARQFERHTIAKRYVAAVDGDPPACAGTIDVPLRRDPADRRRVVVAPDGQPAQTRFAVREAIAGRRLIDLWPQTGRTHQIRAHLAHIGCPIVGDALYGGSAAGRVLLHAAEISFLAPAPEGVRRFTLHSDVPEDFTRELAGAPAHFVRRGMRETACI
jgi:23S rRNA pseudouridine1911/1915/1917 synthase